MDFQKKGPMINKLIQKVDIVSAWWIWIRKYLLVPQKVQRSFVLIFWCSPSNIVCACLYLFCRALKRNACSCFLAKRHVTAIPWQITKGKQWDKIRKYHQSRANISCQMALTGNWGYTNAQTIHLCVNQVTFNQFTKIQLGPKATYSFKTEITWCWQK